MGMSFICWIQNQVMFHSAQLFAINAGSTTLLLSIPLQCWYRMQRYLFRRSALQSLQPTTVAWSATSLESASMKLLKSFRDPEFVLGSWTFALCTISAETHIFPALLICRKCVEDTGWRVDWHLSHLHCSAALCSLAESGRKSLIERLLSRLNFVAATCFAMQTFKIWPYMFYRDPH